MSCVNIRGCRIGEGRPKVILPIVEYTEAAILEKAAQFSTLSADCVEWRADWFEGFQSPAAIARCVQKLRVALRDKLLLVTFRTKAEGGEQALSHPPTCWTSSSSPPGQTCPSWWSKHIPPESQWCVPATILPRPRPGQNSSPAWCRCSRPEPTCPSWP